jgi:hypothetical protein
VLTADAGTLSAMPRLRTADIRAATTTLRGVLDRIGSGELTAPAGVAARLEGAAAALEALVDRRRKRPRP